MDDLPYASSPMPDLDLILSAVNGLHSAATTLTEYARELAQNPAARLSNLEDVPELLADAIVIALEAMPEDHMTDDRNQLVGALRRYLDGGAV